MRFIETKQSNDNFENIEKRHCYVTLLKFSSISFENGFNSSFYEIGAIFRRDSSQHCV